MARLEDLTRGAAVAGVVPDQAVVVVDVRWFGAAAIELTFKRHDGSVANRLLYRDDEPSLSIATAGKPWSFDADPSLFRLASEAKRIDLAYLFDPYLAVTTARVEPLPHQITAVYESMLPRQPLRFLLADDPGAGKTIMAGLLIRELQLRGDLKRCLIVAPGSLVEQWQQELDEKLGLSFRILTRDAFEASRTGNPFAEDDLLIARLDKLARDEEVQLKLAATDWDLVIFDEAHKLSATLSLGEVKKTKRRLLAERVRELTRHFLLLTATPHNGKEDDFQLFLSLLDPDRFEGHKRAASEASPPTADASDLMRRLMKEGLVRFDGTALFPPRHAHVVPYQLSGPEADLYEQVTTYVRDEMNRADRLKAQGDRKRGNLVGFALTVLQRRLASSPEAIYQSLRRRRERLEQRLGEAEAIRLGLEAKLQADAEFEALTLNEIEDVEEDEATAEETEELEDQVVDLATASSTIAELRVEIDILRQLEERAAQVRHLNSDRKWTELASLMADAPEMHDASGTRRKLVVFTEHRDTLRYLSARLRSLVGRDDAVVEIHGGMARDLRKRNEAAFKNDPAVVVLVATDAAGEGINLQRAHLMVNYDLPWNPNRLEQRFGRIHRIGQSEICHLWNLVAEGTREGLVYALLLRKIEKETAALGGQVFDVLGRVEFGERSLRALLIEAIRDGDRPEVRAELVRVVDAALDRDRLRELLDERALAADKLDQSKVQAVREDLERAAARRLQPHFVRSFFLEALKALGGSAVERDDSRYEVTHVPVSVRNHARETGLRLVLPKYERVVFDKDLTSVQGHALAEFVCPGHPLLDAVTDLVLLKFGSLLRLGSILVDRADASNRLRVLIYLEHTITDERPGPTGVAHVVSRRLQFVELDEGGRISDAGPAPFLDYESAAESEHDLISSYVAEDSWPGHSQLEDQAIAFAIERLAREHLLEARGRVEARVAKTMVAVRQRLEYEVSYWDHRARQLEQQETAGHTPKLNSARARARAEELTERLARRTLELEQERQLSSLPPIVVGGAIVVPQGLIDQLDGIVPSGPSQGERVRIEMAAMATVSDEERRRGFEPVDVSAEKCGYHILSRDNRTGRLRFIVVKGRARDESTVAVSKNETLSCLNKPAESWLALVLVDGQTVDRPVYVPRPFTQGVDFGATSVNYAIDQLLVRATQLD